MKTLAGVIAVFSMMMLFAGSSLAASNCHKVHVEATTTAVDPILIFGKYAGSAMVSMDGQPPMPAVVSLVPEMIKIEDDGTIHLTNKLTFDLGPMGSLTVKDNAVITPTENPYVYTMSSKLNNLEGTGMFNGVVGKFADHGQFSFATATISAQADGKICW